MLQQRCRKSLVSVFTVLLLLNLSHIISGFTIKQFPRQVYHGFIGNYHSHYNHHHHHLTTLLFAAAASDEGEDSSSVETKTPTTPVPVLNGKRVLPYKVMKSGLKGHKIAAVYALLDSNYKRGTEGWENVVYVDVTKDLDTTLQMHYDKMGTDKVAHIRALSFSFPEPSAMNEVAGLWKKSVAEAGGFVINPADYLFDEDEDDEDDEFDDDDDEFDVSMIADVASSSSSTSKAVSEQEKEDSIVSPFDDAGVVQQATVTAEGTMPITPENVDKVLDEVRPYLISDGGNVSVEGVDAEKGEVYLKLEGACGRYTDCITD